MNVAFSQNYIYWAGTFQIHFKPSFLCCVYSVKLKDRYGSDVIVGIEKRLIVIRDEHGYRRRSTMTR
jgi:hypothetical protein